MRLIFLFSLFLVLNADQCKRVSVEYKFFSAAFMDLELRNRAKFFDRAMNCHQHIDWKHKFCVLPDLSVQFI